MAKGRKRGRRTYSREFREQMVALVRAGRSPEELAKEFEPSGQTIRNWVTQAEASERKRRGKVAGDPEELERLRRENKQLRMERDILSKAAAWFARETEAASTKSTPS